MHVALVGTYPPRACGIATFTADVGASLTVDPSVDRVSVVAVGADPADVCAPVVATIDADDAESYAAAARAVDGVDVVLVQHEFGVFGGPDGAHVQRFLDAFPGPVAVTLHTVLPRFSDGQSAVVASMCERADAVLAFTSSARRLLLDQSLVRASKVRVVPHGAPIELYRPVDRAAAQTQWGWAGRRVVSTFGLLSPGKGIEHAIRAIATVAEKVPEVCYVVAGRTHPEVARRDGERYRQDLNELVRELGLENHVCFVDRFLSMDELAALLGASDVFCTPYVGEEQIVSGALTFAVAAGVPVVSTPYRYARDLLADGAGLLVPFADSDGIAAGLGRLLTDRLAWEEARYSAVRAGKSMSWPEVGHQTAAVLAEIACIRRAGGPTRLVPALIPIPTLPAAIPVSHLEALIDSTGICQHAEFEVPRWESGYCVDDVARFLPIAGSLAADDPRWSVHVLRALAFLRAASLGGGGRMRNFCGPDRRFLDEPHPGDHVGRAIWGLGELIGLGGAPAFAQHLATELATEFPELGGHWVRNDAYAVLGLVAWGDARPSSLEGVVEVLVERIRRRFDDHASDDWRWCEPRLTYDNARLPEALIRGGALLGRSEVVAEGLLALDWLDRMCRSDLGWYRWTGHRGLAPGGLLDRSGDEQPLEAAAFVDACRAAWDVTGDERHRSSLERAAAWFVGLNRLGIPVGSCVTGACGDGLGATATNQNQGAESTLAFLRTIDTCRRLAARLGTNPVPTAAPLRRLVRA